MAMRLRAIRIPDHVVSEMQVLSHLESIKRGKTVTWSGLVRELAEDFIRRERGQGVSTSQP